MLFNSILVHALFISINAGCFSCGNAHRFAVELDHHETVARAKALLKNQTDHELGKANAKNRTDSRIKLLEMKYKKLNDTTVANITEYEKVIKLASIAKERQELLAQPPYVFKPSDLVPSKVFMHDNGTIQEEYGS